MSYHSSSGSSQGARRSNPSSSVPGGRRLRTNATQPGGKIKRSTPNRPKMNTVRTNRGGQLKVSSRTQEVEAPKGYHWMQENGRYYLMKGEYKPHAGASRTAKFKLVNHG